MVLSEAASGGETIFSAESTQRASGNVLPLRIGSTEDFAHVRDYLRAIGFDERAIKVALKIPDIGRIANCSVNDLDRGAAGPALLAAIEFLLLGEALAPERLQACWGEAFAAMAALGLIREARHRSGALICPVWLYPVDGLVIASDRNRFPQGDPVPPAGEAVFPAHDAATLQLLRLLPRSSLGEALDLCGGSGIGALHLARAGSRAVTADITARAAHFAAFNAALNGIAIEVLRGDLYASVAGRKFAIVCAHPPWLPSTGDQAVFRDGGETGEAIVERVFAGLPHHLGDGGTAVVVALGHDARDGGYETRVRRWLGETGGDCDVLLGVNKVISIEEMAASLRQLHLGGDVEKAQGIAARLLELGTQKFVHGAVFVRRTAAAVMEPPLRLRMAADATAADFERIFAWRGRRRLPDFADWLAAARPRLSDGLESTYRYGRREGAVAANSALLIARRPLAATVQLEAWMARLIERLDGLTPVADAFEAARQSGQMPADFTLAGFVGLVGQMVERGIIDVEGP
jgi:SAM-dependent methyltransferase